MDYIFLQQKSASYSDKYIVHENIFMDLDRLYRIIEDMVAKTAKLNIGKKMYISKTQKNMNSCSYLSYKHKLHVITYNKTVIFKIHSPTTAADTAP
jgi:hypothetical protein